MSHGNDSHGCRWAILGSSRIAASYFVPSLRAVGGRAEVVGSRDAAGAAAFATRHGVARAVDGYRAAVEDPNVDAVYVALPNHLHAEWTIAALSAGKAVLCEKPMALTTSDAQAITAAAAATGRPLWEAFAFVFHPQTVRVEQLIRGGAIGRVQEISSWYYSKSTDQTDIRYSEEMGGGALLDLGVYPIRLARLVLGGRASAVSSTQVRCSTGVDVDTDAAVELGQGRRLRLAVSFRKGYDHGARIFGDRGQIHIASPFEPMAARPITLRVPGYAPLVEQIGDDRPLFADQLAHIHAVLRDGAPARHLAVEDAEYAPAIVAAISRSATVRSVSQVEDAEP